VERDDPITGGGLLTKGRVIVRGKTVKRGEAKKVDYVLSFKPNMPIAVVEAKDNNHLVGAGMQQSLEYAELPTLVTPFDQLSVSARESAYASASAMRQAASTTLLAMLAISLASQPRGHGIWPLTSPISLCCSATSLKPAFLSIAALCSHRVRVYFLTFE
jgi:hypothetical protein